MRIQTSKGRQNAIESYQRRIQKVDKGLVIAATYGVLECKPVEPYASNNVPRLMRTFDTALRQLQRRNYWAEQTSELASMNGIVSDIRQRELAYYIAHKKEIHKSARKKGPQTSLIVRLS